jgi:hypothetical protein
LGDRMIEAYYLRQALRAQEAFGIRYSPPACWPVAFLRSAARSEQLRSMPRDCTARPPTRRRRPEMGAHLSSQRVCGRRVSQKPGYGGVRTRGYLGAGAGRTYGATRRLPGMPRARFPNSICRTWSIFGNHAVPGHEESYGNAANTDRFRTGSEHFEFLKRERRRCARSSTRSNTTRRFRRCSIDTGLHSCTKPMDPGPR